MNINVLKKYSISHSFIGISKKALLNGYGNSNTKQKPLKKGLFNLNEYLTRFFVHLKKS